jgi:hypothetical protein
MDARLCAGAKKKGEKKKTHLTGEASPIFLMDERDYTSRVLSDDAIDRTIKSIQKIDE